MRLFRVILTICRANPVQKEPIVAGTKYSLLIYCNIMEISTDIDERKPKKNGDMGVKISVRRANKTVFINTGLFTKVKFTGTEFLCLISQMVTSIKTHGKEHLVDIEALKILDYESYSNNKREPSDSLCGGDVP